MIDRFHHLFIRPADFDASLRFYRDSLGWSVVEEWGEGKPGARGVTLSSGGMKLVLAESQEAGKEDEGRPHLHLDIHDIDKRFARLPKDAQVVQPPQATHWGTRWFVVKDPDGNLIAFEQLRGS